MVTPDKDYAQLVDKNVYLYKPARMGNGVDILDVDRILEKWQIKRIDQVVDVLGLKGDSVDNIPGIPGVGEKTAIKLLREYDNLENILENADDIKGALGNKIRENKEAALMSKKLAKIDINCPITFSEFDYRIQNFDRASLEKLFIELEFRSLAKSILLQNSTPSQKQGSLFPIEKSTDKKKSE